VLGGIGRSRTCYNSTPKFIGHGQFSNGRTMAEQSCDLHDWIINQIRLARGYDCGQLDHSLAWSVAPSVASVAAAAAPHRYTTRRPHSHTRVHNDPIVSKTVSETVSKTVEDCVTVSTATPERAHSMCSAMRSSCMKSPCISMFASTIPVNKFSMACDLMSSMRLRLDCLDCLDCCGTSSRSCRSRTSCSSCRVVVSACMLAATCLGQAGAGLCLQCS